MFNLCPEDVRRFLYAGRGSGVNKCPPWSRPVAAIASAHVSDRGPTQRSFGIGDFYFAVGEGRILLSSAPSVFLS